MSRIYDRWDIETLRAAAEYNRANPDPEFAESIQWVEDELLRAEAQVMHHDTRPADVQEPVATRSGGSGHTNYNATGASEAQERFIRSLCAERGVDADALLATIKDKRAASAAIDQLKAQKPTAAHRPATPKQLDLITNLLSEREFDGDVDLDSLDPQSASELIDRLFAAPRASKAAHGIRQGRYAFQPADGNPAQFYRVSRTGRITVIAGPAEHPYNGKLNTALEAIKADPQAGAALYGQLIGSCGRCGLTLTDETSRSIGLGPICASKTDW